MAMNPRDGQGEVVQFPSARVFPAPFEPGAYVIPVNKAATTVLLQLPATHLVGSP
jgi:hypothetical protein